MNFAITNFFRINSTQKAAVLSLDKAAVLSFDNLERGGLQFYCSLLMSQVNQSEIKYLKEQKTETLRRKYRVVTTSQIKCYHFQTRSSYCFRTTDSRPLRWVVQLLFLDAPFSPILCHFLVLKHLFLKKLHFVQNILTTLNFQNLST